ncbi:OmpA family protein [Paracoccus laeviglucosivorans]|nr:OmpA family protein [Paracoccus laeviglucosivorans]
MPNRNHPEQAGNEQQPNRAQQQRQQQAGNQPRLSPQDLQNRLREGNGEAKLPPPEASGQQNDIARRAAEGAKIGPAAALAANGEAKGEVSERKISDDDRRRSDQDFRTRVQDGERRGEGQRRLTDEEMRRDLERRERNLREGERDLRDGEREADRREDRLDRRDAWMDRRDNRWDDRRDEWRDNDDDDNSSDIAKLLLAGAAGFAVGKMMSGNRQVALNTGDRAVLMLPDGSQQVVRDDNALLYQPGSDVRTETYQDGSTRTTVLRSDGSQVVTIRDADMNILRRTLIRPNGTETRLIDDTAVQPVDVATLPAPQPVVYTNRPWQEDELRQALLTESSTDRRFTLGQIRDIPEVRSLVAPVNVPEITFDTGSAALSSGQAEQLATLGKVIGDAVQQNPNEIFMIEGYTDSVGSNAANLALSDRRAESVALALTEYFQVPPENMVVQGYGEQFQLVPSDGDERENRRVSVRRITDLLEQGS